MRRFGRFESWPNRLPDFNRRCRVFGSKRQEFRMPSVERITVQKYRIVAEVMEACPMFVRAKVQVYEITGSVGQYRHQFEVKASRKDIEALDRDLEKFVVEIPENVNDLSRRDEQRDD